MTWPTRHEWPTTVEEAVPIQQQLRSEVICQDQLGPIRYIAGVDVGFEEEGQRSRAAVAVLEWPGLALVDQSIACQPTQIPYVPGFLSFREVPVVLEALAGLKRQPDLILCDGQGYAHPRRFGYACHLGVLTDLPTIGVAKSRLIGRHEPVPEQQGAWVPLWDQQERIGAVVRTQRRVNPLFVSCGHRISLETAIQYVMGCVTRYRLPETTRWADRLASQRHQRTTRRSAAHSSGEQQLSLWDESNGI